jgi:uncharacterized protein (TIRG00374 family)
MKAYILAALKILTSILVLWFLTHTSKLDFSLLLKLFYSPYLLLLTISIYYSGVFISAWRWYILNKTQNLPLSLSQTVLPTYIGIAFNNLFPGSIGGDFYRGYFVCKKIPDKRSAGLLAILLDRITGLMGIFIAVCVSTALHFNSIKSNAATFYFVVFCIALCSGILLLYFLSSTLPAQLGISKWLDTHHGHRKGIKTIMSLLDAVRVYRNSKLAISKCLFISFMVQIFIALNCYLIAKMMHFPEISFYHYILAIAITQLVNLIPLTPGGFGLGEAAFANVLSFLNPFTAASYATIFLGYRLLGILLYLPAVVIFIFDRQLLNPHKMNRRLEFEKYPV